MEPDAKKPKITWRRVWIGALILLWVIGLVLILIGRSMIAAARADEDYARKAGAFATAAELAWDRVNKGQGMLRSKDTVRATEQLDLASAYVDLMQAMAPPEDETLAGQAKSQLDAAKQQVPTDPDGAANTLDRAGKMLYRLSGKKDE